MMQSSHARNHSTIVLMGVLMGRVLMGFTGLALAAGCYNQNSSDQASAVIPKTTIPNTTILPNTMIESTTRRAIPAIDAATPRHTRTATFALG